MPAPIFLVTGPAAAGKTTTARALAARFPQAVHVPVDDLRAMVVAGLQAPAPDWGDGLRTQLALARETASGIATRYAAAGFTVVVDDFFDPLGLAEYAPLLARPGTRPVLLLPDADTCLRRNASRPVPDPTADRAIDHAEGFLRPRAPGLRRAGWLVLDTTAMGVDEVVAAILATPAPAS